MGQLLDCFMAYDVRGRVPDELNVDLAYRIGRAYVQFLDAKQVVVGHDMRLSSKDIVNALQEGLTDGGADVINIGLCGTEEVYYATFSQQTDGGIMVTASHNPADYNGMKMVRAESRPISADTGLGDIEALAVANDFPAVTNKGTVTVTAPRSDYINFLMTQIDVDKLKPLKIVMNAGNGCAGLVADELVKRLPFEFIQLQNEPDGTFPNGVPNPLLPENRAITADAVREHQADLGIAWDGDFDRCFFFDERGEFIEGYYIVGLIAQAMLARHSGEKIVYDPRLTWSTVDLVESNGGEAVMSKSGHAFIKQTMREVDAIYGGEMSAHHYFRDFAYCDNGHLPWLFVAQLICEQGQTLSEMVTERMQAFPASGEINRKVGDAQAVIAAIEAHYAPSALNVDHTDGVAVEFADWRFNLRASNTEPVIRLNVESRGNEALMQEKTEQILQLMLAVDQQNN